MGVSRLFFVQVKGLEGEAVQRNSPVDCSDRGRPSAQFARESSPLTRTKETPCSLWCGVGLKEKFKEFRFADGSQA